MKTLYKLIFLSIFLLNFSNSIAQVTTSIEDVLVNNQTTITSCNTINFLTNSNNALEFFFRLQKSSAGYCSNGTLRIMLKYSSSTYGSQRGGHMILSSINWDNNNKAQGYISCNISESEVQVTGSSIYLEYTDCNNNITTSCEYPITKTPIPTFTGSVSLTV